MILFNKHRRLVKTTPLLLAGAVYFSCFGALTLHPLVKQQLFLLPIQLGVLIYLLWWRPRHASNVQK
jgi:hypothetical protein